MSAAPPTSHRSRQIALARSTLLGDGAPSFAGVEPWIARSWQRCLAAGQRPTQRVTFQPVGAQQLRQTQERHHDLLRAARPVLEQLTRAITGMRYFAMLTDARGTVIEVQGAQGHGDPRARAIGRVGVDLSEACVGTTAIGAALSELQPVWLHQGEHFFDDNQGYSCAGAPLFGPEGECIGMLDLTGVDVPERPELRHLVARSAHAMEDALLLQCPHALLLRLNWPGAVLGHEGDGLLALDAEGFVVGTNGMARQLLPQPLQAPGSRLHCDELLALPWGQLFDAARRGGATPLALPVWSGLRLAALPCLPARAAPLRLPTGAAPLRAAEAALIRQAVQDARGNVAEAARTLGISRATVYRRLGGR